MVALRSPTSSSREAKTAVLIEPARERSGRRRRHRGSRPSARSPRQGETRGPGSAPRCGWGAGGRPSSCPARSRSRFSDEGRAAICRSDAAKLRTAIRWQPPTPFSAPTAHRPELASFTRRRAALRLPSAGRRGALRGPGGARPLRSALAGFLTHRSRAIAFASSSSAYRVSCCFSTWMSDCSPAGLPSVARSRAAATRFLMQRHDLNPLKFID